MKKNIGLIAAAALVLMLALVLWDRFSESEPDPQEIALPTAPYQFVKEGSEVEIKYFGQEMGWLTATVPIRSVIVEQTDKTYKLYSKARWSDAKLSDEQYRPAFEQAYRKIDAGGNNLDAFWTNIRFAKQPEQLSMQPIGWLTSGRVQEKLQFYFVQDWPADQDGIVRLHSDRHVLMSLKKDSGEKLRAALANISQGHVSEIAEVRYRMNFRYQP